MSSHSRMVLVIDTNVPVGTLQDIANDSSTRKYTFFRKIITLFKAFSGGDFSAFVSSGVVDSGAFDANSSSIVATFTGSPTANDTISINGVTLTFVASASPTNNQVSLAGSPSTSTLATRLANAINSSTTDALMGVVGAVASAATVTIYCLIPGVIGDSILLTDSAANFSFASAATKLTGGAGGLPVLNTFTYGKIDL